MEPVEVEFFGEKEIIGIVPSFTIDAMHLISGTVGPFRAGIPIHVPLWIAVHLRKQQKCRFVPPEWMEVDKLEEIKQEEKTSRYFTKMPHEHYMVISKLVLGAGAEDVPRSQEVRTLVKDLWDMRMSKLKTSIDMFISGKGTYAKLDNLTMLELNTVRPLLTEALDTIAEVQRTERRSASSSMSLNQSSSGFNSSSFRS